MMRKTFRISTAIALLTLSACSQYMSEDIVFVEEPVVVEEPSTPQSKSSCGTTDIDDGIGGTGCPAPVS